MSNDTDFEVLFKIPKKEFNQDRYMLEVDELMSKRAIELVDEISKQLGESNETSIRHRD